jgi:two-component system, OmpR family, phosphate regulon response regulator PhoB
MMLALNMSNNTDLQNLGTVINRVLVVEDEESIRELIVMGLEEEGFEVVAVGDGQTALTKCQVQTLQPQDFPFDLIVLDLMIPQVNGLDLCRFLRYKGNHVPILIVSAKTTETDRVLGLEIGADDYISKPFSMREFVARCRALLRRHRLNVSIEPSIVQFQLNQQESPALPVLR